MTLKVQTRTAQGKQNKALRRQGIVTGSISLSNKETLMLQTDALEALSLLKIDGSEMFQVEVEGGKTFNAVLSELIVNPLDNKIENFSLTELTPTSHVTVRVPITITGIAPAVKNNLGTLVVNIPELRITVNSENIVDSLNVDISDLTDTGSRILVSGIPGIEKIKLASEKDRTLTVVTVRPLRQLSATAQQAANAVAAETTEAAK
jgi:large subunit ribosomal protein L25